MMYCNQNFENIDKYVKSGRTKVFKPNQDLNFIEAKYQAQRHADYIRSYIFPLFELVRYDLFNAEIKHVGYAVPN